MIESRKFFGHQIRGMYTKEMSFMFKKYGYAGYGLYWRIVEVMFDEQDTRIEMSDILYEHLSASEFDENGVKSFIDDCVNKYCLFDIDKDNRLFSEWVVKEAIKIDALYKQRVDASAKGVASRKKIKDMLLEKEFKAMGF